LRDIATLRVLTPTTDATRALPTLDYTTTCPLRLLVPRTVYADIAVAPRLVTLRAPLPDVLCNYCVPRNYYYSYLPHLWITAHRFTVLNYWFYPRFQHLPTYTLTYPFTTCITPACILVAVALRGWFGSLAARVCCLTFCRLRSYALVWFFTGCLLFCRAHFTRFYCCHTHHTTHGCAAFVVVLTRLLLFVVYHSCYVWCFRTGTQFIPAHTALLTYTDICACCCHFGFYSYPER